MPRFGAQPVEELEDLQPDGRVERRRRLVGDQQLRIARERHRDHRALPLAAGKLVRIAARAALGLFDADAAHRVDGAASRASSRFSRFVQLQRLGDLVADREHRVERRHRLLKDDRDVAAAQFVQLRLAASRARCGLRTESRR